MNKSFTDVPAAADMKLRPHHLLCTQGFSGNGYSKAFVENMISYVSRMRTEPGFTVMLTDMTDDLCRSCPNKIDEKRCEDDDKVLVFDRNVLEAFHLTTGKTYLYQELIRHIDETLTPEMMKNICGSCSWFPVSACEANALSGKYLLP